MGEDQVTDLVASHMDLNQEEYSGATRSPETSRTGNRPLHSKHMEWFLNADFSTSPTPLHLTALGLLLSFLCGHLVAWVYMMTHTGLSYSRTFVQS
jgi:hypothetical protein